MGGEVINSGYGQGSVWKSFLFCPRSSRPERSGDSHGNGEIVRFNIKMGSFRLGTMG